MKHRNYLSNSEKLKIILDRIYGFEKQTGSKVKKVSQSYNEIFNEHVFLIEYRIMMNKQKNEDVPGDHVVFDEEDSLLHRINTLVG